MLKMNIIKPEVTDHNLDQDAGVKTEGKKWTTF